MNEVVDVGEYGGSILDSGFSKSSNSQRYEKSEIEWPEPGELIAIGEHKEYPVGAFPDDVGRAILEVTKHGKMPTAIAAGSAMSAMSVAIQSLADVARDKRLIGPCSLSMLVIAESGERKSTADRAMAAPVKEWEVSKRKEMEPEVQKARAKYSAWQAKLEGAKSAIKRTQANGPKMKGVEIVGPSLSDLEARLIELEQDPAPRPIEPHIFHEDTSAEGLAWHVATGWPSQALWSDEGALVVGGQGMRKESLLGFLGLLNRLWDGQTFRPTRKVALTEEIRGKRFTSNMMIQPEILQTLAGTGPSRGVGFLSRYLVAYPKSTMGSRPYTLPKGFPVAVPAFGARLQELLNEEPLRVDGHLSPTVIHLSDEARTVWARFHDVVEAGMKAYGEFADIRDIASKIADNAARIACLFHVYQFGVTGQIQPETMANAVAVAAWYLNDAKRAFGELAEPEHIANARSLSNWLSDGAGGHSENGILLANKILQHGPRCVRKKADRDEALYLLADLNHIRLGESKTGAALCYVNPYLKGTSHE